MNQNENAPWKYKPDNGKPSNTDAETDTSDSPPAKTYSAKSVAWQAPEFIEVHRSTAWYILLAVSTAVLAGLVYILSKDVFASVIILIVGSIVGVFEGHKPSQASYEITDSGLSVNGKIYKYADFKSFAVIHEETLSSINLFPLKRLMPPVSAYFEKADEKKIVDTLGNYLPYEDRQLDAVDRLSRRLRL